MFTADIDQTRWSSFDRFIINDDAPAEELVQPSELVYDWKNTIRYSLGLDYKIYENFNIYMGYYIDPSPVPDNTISPLVPDNGNKKSLTLGARYSANMIGLTFGYEYLTGKKRTVTGSPQDVNEDGISDNLPGNYTLISNVFKIGLEILF